MKTGTMVLLEDDDKGLCLMDQVVDHADLAGSGSFNVQLENRWFVILC